ncbi:hypothetical protein BDZ91DRAFT_298 [Kalaharituber pfeilii]|nr:hypothetical protein BDZ91DRAFT_298 [Kalaharituber pfeilii]
MGQNQSSRFHHNNHSINNSEAISQGMNLIRPRARPHFSSVSTPMSVYPSTRHTNYPAFYQNTARSPSIASDGMSRESYPGSPSLSIISSNSSTFNSSSLPLETHDYYSPRAEKFICPMYGCLYSALGFGTAEELESHMTTLGHYPETATVVDPQVTILNYENALENTGDWLASQQEHVEVQQLFSVPSPTYEFTFTSDQPKQFPPSSPKTPASPTGSQCDCQHCQLQLQGISAYTYSNLPRRNPKSLGMTSSLSQKKKKTIYDLPTPLTVQMPPPPIIINLPPPPKPSTAAKTANPSKPTVKSSSPNINEYSLWQQQIQIAQVTEMLQSQQRQRETQRRILEETPQNAVNRTSSGYRIPGEQDNSCIYGFPRPSASFSTNYPAA